MALPHVANITVPNPHLHRLTQEADHRHNRLLMEVIQGAF